MKLTRGNIIYRLSEVTINKHADDSYKPTPTDDVYPLKYYKWVVYSAEDAVRAHQETHHPTMYNQPNQYVYARVEFDMSATKKVFQIIILYNIQKLRVLES